MANAPRRTLLAAGLVAGSITALSACGSPGGAWWGLRANVGPGTTVVPIGVRLGSSSCHRLDRVEVVETDTSVTIRASVARTGHRDCTADLAVEVVEVPLAGPLADRELRGCEHDDRRRCDEVSAPLG